LLGGGVFGFGLALSEMAKPEVVLAFLQLADFGLLLVMGGASVVAGTAILLATRSRYRAPLTGTQFRRRLRSFDQQVVLGGGIFGIGWGLSGICPGAAYASLGLGNVTILYAIVGMFIGAYIQGRLRGAAEELSADVAASRV
jgi:uncharacterized membrane protein YedE/YeeE